jgi:hypothetical protein
MESNRETAYDARVSAGFAETDDKVEWVLGYPFALRALGVGGRDAPETLLDYGCGLALRHRTQARTVHVHPRLSAQG